MVVWLALPHPALSRRERVKGAGVDILSGKNLPFDLLQDEGGSATLQARPWCLASGGGCFGHPIATLQLVDLVEA